MPVPKTPLKTPPRMFETRSQSWQEAGLIEQVSPGAVRRARWHALLLIPLFVAIVVLYEHRYSLLGHYELEHGELKWLNGLLGAPRDMDVAVGRLQQVSERQPDAQSSYQSWCEKCADSHRRLAQALRSDRYRRLGRRRRSSPTGRR